MTTEISTPQDETAATRVPSTHPIAFFFFFWGEFAERCSYYGMRAILPLYLTDVLQYNDTTGGAIYYRFKMASYALPLLGGYLADRFFGKYWTIVGFSIPYVLGHFILGIENHTAVIIALILLAGGSGVIKPNISTLLGQTYDQQRPGQTQLRSSAFMWFYFAINVGALISTIALPWIRTEKGYATAFQFPAWLMVASLAIFALGKPFYATETITYSQPTPEQRQQRWRTIGQLLGIFGLMVLFWIPYEHNDSLWVFFSRDYVDLKVPFLSLTLQPDQLQFLNPLCVMIFAPLFGLLFPIVDPESRFFTTRNKILIGFGAGTLACGMMTAAGYLANPDARISILWLVGAYILLTIGEILVYGTGLDLAFSAAPPDMKGFITGCFLLTTTIANFFNNFWVHFYGGSLKDAIQDRGSLSPGLFFGISGLFVLAAALIMIFMKDRFNFQTEPNEA